MINYTVYASNIKCGGCAKSITSKLCQINDIENVEVEVETGKITFDAVHESLVEDVKKQLASMGYPEDDPNMLQTAKSYVSCMIGRMK